MWRVTLTGVVAHRLRYAMTALAVLLGVAFIAGTFVLNDTINETFNRLYSQIYQGTSAVVRAAEPFNPGAGFSVQRQRIPARLAGRLARVPGVRAVAVDVEGYAQLVARDGKPVGASSSGAPTLGVAWTGVAALSPLRLLPGGRAPRTSTQVVIDEHSARAGHFRTGDKVLVLTQRPPARYTITGIATWGRAGSPLGATITAFAPATAARVLGQAGMVSQIDVEAAPGVSQPQLMSRLQAAIRTPGVQVVSGQAVVAEGQQSIHQALSFVGVFLLVFAFVALFTGSFVIFNTFSIVVAQRLRELALLRAIGASRRQVMASVLGESVIIGVLASAAGLGAGIGLAVALKAGLAALGFDLPATGLVVSPRTVLVSLAAGVAVTVVSAVSPARRAARIPPVAAMQDVAAEPRRPSVMRAVRGAILLAGGAAALGDGLAGPVLANTVLAGTGPAGLGGNRVTLVGAGAVAVFTGIAILGPFCARPVSRLLGTLLAMRGTTGRLGRQNAMRNPARTAVTAAALMVGVTLVSLTAIVASSVKASVNTIIDSAVRADFVVSSGTALGGSSGFSPRLERSVAALRQVSATAGVRAGVAKVYGKVTPVVATDPAQAAPLFNLGVTRGRLAAMTSAGIAVSTQVAASQHLVIGSPVTVTFASTGSKAYTVQVIYGVRDVAGDYILPLATARANFPQALDVDVFVKLAPGVSAKAGRQAIGKVLAAYPNATLMDQVQYKARQAQQVNQMLNLVYGLLALAVIIALIGIANTLALSVYERTRELGVLRAVGTTRGQLRAIVRAESVIISLFGALEGLLLGMIFGWAIVAVLRSRGVTHLVFPVRQLLIMAVLAGLAGVVAAIAPSRRAARLDILRAVTTE
jgi:putative ABC transport system permease protein